MQEHYFFFHTGWEFIKSNYVFCSGKNHNSKWCAKVADPYLCYACMSLEHKASKCIANYVCKKKKKHISICQKGNLKSTGKNNFRAKNNSTNVQPTLPSTHHDQTKIIPNSYQ